MQNTALEPSWKDMLLYLAATLYIIECALREESIDSDTISRITWALTSGPMKLALVGAVRHWLYETFNPNTSQSKS